MGEFKKNLVSRYSGNPILTKDDVPYPVVTVHNPAVTKYKDRYVMLFRSHLRNGRSIIGLAESEDGFHFRVFPEPFMVPADNEPFKTYEEFGVEDPRITFMRLFQKTLGERSPLPLGGTSLTPYPIPHPLNQQRFQRGKIPWRSP